MCFSKESDFEIMIRIQPITYSTVFAYTQHNYNMQITIIDKKNCVSLQNSVHVACWSNTAKAFGELNKCGISCYAAQI